MADDLRKTLIEGLNEDPAAAAGEHGLAAEFDQILADESNHRDELRQMLARWP